MLTRLLPSEGCEEKSVHASLLASGGLVAVFSVPCLVEHHPDLSQISSPRPHFFFFFNQDAGHIELGPTLMTLSMGFPGGSDGKESACNAGDPGSILGLRRSLREGNGYPLEYSCLKNFMDRGAWQAADRRVAKSQTRLSE